MASAREIESHDAIVRLDHAQKRRPVGSRTWNRIQFKTKHSRRLKLTRVGLDVHTPLLWIQAKDLERALLAQRLDLVNHLVSTIITLARKALNGKRKKEKAHLEKETHAHRHGTSNVLRKKSLARTKMISRTYPSEYLLVAQLPFASCTAREQKFSDAISSNPCTWRCFSSTRRAVQQKAKNYSLQIFHNPCKAQKNSPKISGSASLSGRFIDCRAER